MKSIRKVSAETYQFVISIKKISTNIKINPKFNGKEKKTKPNKKNVSNPYPKIINK